MVVRVLRHHVPRTVSAASAVVSEVCKRELVEALRDTGRPAEEQHLDRKLSSFEVNWIGHPTPPASPAPPDGPGRGLGSRWIEDHIEGAAELVHRATRGRRMEKTKSRHDLSVREATGSVKLVISVQPSLQATAAPHRSDAVAPPSRTRQLQ